MADFINKKDVDNLFQQWKEEASNSNLPTDKALEKEAEELYKMYDAYTAAEKWVTIGMRTGYVKDRSKSMSRVRELEQEVEQLKAGFKGSNFTEPVAGITLGCISPEARNLLDTIMAEWELHHNDLKKNNPNHELTFYGFAYWLVRWSGLIQPASTNKD
jgi:hypothetical protein